MDTLRATRPIRLLVAVVLLAVLAPAAADAAPNLRAEETRFLRLMNDARTARDLRPLSASPGVAAVARRWSRRMAADGTLRHNPEVGRQLPLEWTRWGENVGWASGGGDLAAVTRRLHRGFMDSPGHRANILGRFNQVGVGVALDRSGTMWATMVFVQAPIDRRPSPATPGLSDVAGNPHRPAITTAVARGLMEPCDARRFCPARVVTRAAVAEVVARMLDLPPRRAARFDDVDAGSPSAVNALAAAGIVEGCTADRFCPRRPVTRAQLASLLVRALPDLRPVTGGRFDDLPAGYVHSGAINALAAAGITRGCTADRFCPTGDVTRAQLASFVTRALDH